MPLNVKVQVTPLSAPEVLSSVPSHTGPGPSPGPAPLTQLRMPAEDWHSCPGSQVWFWHARPFPAWHTHCCRQLSVSTVCPGCGDKGHSHQGGADSNIFCVPGTEGPKDMKGTSFNRGGPWSVKLRHMALGSNLFIHSFTSTNLFTHLFKLNFCRVGEAV